MRTRFCSFACGVQKSKMFTVDTTEEGLGNNNGHIFAVALNVNTWNYQKNVLENIVEMLYDVLYELIMI